MKRRQYILLISATVLCGFSAWTFSDTNESYAEKHTEIVLRDIGHQLLLHAHDSTSRVLPVKKIEENSYQIEFQSSFSFVPDTLVTIIDKHLKKYDLEKDYLVNVLNCYSQSIIFGYEVSTKNNNVLPCLGRTQAKDCYVIQIVFLNSTKRTYFWLLTFPFLLFLFYFIKNNLSEKTIFNTPEQDYIKLGEFVFLPIKSQLKIRNEIIELSNHENKLLGLLNKQANQVLDRDYLIQEIWEKEGVIVTSRSLDVLVSKLRKKLNEDSSIQIINSHSKGYKLVTH
jgi:DNA-binding winged helix-turn-helix (wHTH) protein